MSGDPFAACRPRLLGIAYGILGELAEAEDVVQDAWLRWQGADRAAVRNPEAFLVTVTTRLAISALRSARARREVYVGTWLPDPLLTDMTTPESLAIEAERLNLAVLGALERLNPVERAVLVLRDVFDLEYAEIADAVDKTPGTVRQIAKRARDHAGDESRTRTVSAEERQRLAIAFLEATTSGDVERIRGILAADAIMYSDGGGAVTASRKPLHGADRIARFLVALQRNASEGPAPKLTPVWVNGDPGLRFDDAEGRFLGILAVQVGDGWVQAIRSFMNPERFPADFPRGRKG